MNTITALSSLDAVILAGGIGSRLKPVVSDRPKPLARINGSPFLDLLIQDLRLQGLCRFVFCVSHQREQIVSHFQSRNDAEFLFSEEISPLGTGGAVRHALPLIRSNHFLLLNGDSYCKVNLNDFVTFHKNKKSKASLVVSESRGRNDGGNIDLIADGRINSFQEKTYSSSEKRPLINAGIYLLSRDLPLAWQAKDPFSLEKDVFPDLVSAGHCFGFLVGTEVIDIGTPERYAKAQQQLSNISKVNSNKK